MRITFRWVTTVIVVGVITIAGYYYLVGNFRVFVVQSGSMEPTLPFGSVVITQPSQQLHVGDIITFKTNANAVVTHRINQRTQTLDGLAFQTQGDANKQPDETLVPVTSVIGSVHTIIPQLGKLFLSIRTLPGYLLIVVIPSLFLLLQGFLTLFEGIKKQDGTHTIEIIASVVICFGALLFASKGTAAFFTASDTATGNTFTTANLFGAETVNYLVISEVLYDTNQTQSISGQGGSNRGEWVEIYNPTLSAVDLTSWTISDGSETESLSGSLAAGSVLIVTGATETEFEAVWTVPDGVQYIVATGGKIGNGLAEGGGRIELHNASNTLVDSMSWGTDTTGFVSGCTSTCPTTTTGSSLERNPANSDTNDSSDFDVQPSPAPGQVTL